MCGTVCQRQCSLLSHWTFFDAVWKLNCSSVLTTDTAPVKRLYCCVTQFHFPAVFFAVAATLKSIYYNVAMTFILNNNYNNNNWVLKLKPWSQHRYDESRARLVRYSHEALHTKTRYEESRTRNSAVAKRPRGASCLSVVSFNSTKHRAVFCC